ncbi:AAA domain-containing protein [Massilia sp. CCM 8733]|uniref:AAA domain-containing protein n=2 Tax=Massilia mucilaginosa TaxID=2609282 RepID=A0ABX0NXH7_9BURK|nr:AAA domain-containing protein [Massilia mucilaginosa]
MSVTVSEIINALRRHKNVLLYGPPGTGKSHLMNEVARLFSVDDDGAEVDHGIFVDTGSEAVPLVVGSAARVPSRWVTFHQGYSYEDFVLGLRPHAAPGGGFSLVPRPGVLLELAAEAQQGAGLLLIDEINRGNTSRIFGEFITLMEPSKRLDAAGNETLETITLTLPYLAPGESINVITAGGAERELHRHFAMPAGLYTLASMNSVDKSIAPIDTAMRRRFHTINLFPSTHDLRSAVGLPPSDSAALDPIGGIDTNDGVARLAVRVMEKLNRGIGLHLGQDFMLGHWYLQAVRANAHAAIPDALVETWLFRILPQLIELFHGRTEVLIALLGLDLSDAGSGLQVHEPDSDESEAGAMAYLASAEPAPQSAAVLAFLQRFAGAPQAQSTAP